MNIKFNIIFSSENLYFVNVNKSLADDYLLMMNNPKISKYLSLKNRVFTYDNEIKWVEEKIRNKSKIFSIIEKKSNKFVGNIEVMEEIDDTAIIGIVITEDMQNKHYGSEALIRFIDYLFNDLKYKEIELSVYSHNLKAIHCYEKLGFVEYKRDKNVGEIDNQLVDDIYMKYDKRGNYHE